jgi:hypothetical protein
MNEYIIHFNKLEKTPALQRIEDTIVAMQEAEGEAITDSVIAVMEAIRMAITMGEKIIVPVEVPEESLDAINAAAIKVGDIVEVDQIIILSTGAQRIGQQLIAAVADAKDALIRLGVERTVGIQNGRVTRFRRADGNGGEVTHGNVTNALERCVVKRGGEAENVLHGTVDGFDIALEIDYGVGQIGNVFEHVVDFGVKRMNGLGIITQSLAANGVDGNQDGADHGVYYQK